jgi:hypothetical protein
MAILKLWHQKLLIVNQTAIGVSLRTSYLAFRLFSRTD